MVTILAGSSFGCAHAAPTNPATRRAPPSTVARRILNTLRPPYTWADIPDSVARAAADTSQSRDRRPSGRRARTPIRGRTRRAARGRRPHRARRRLREPAEGTRSHRWRRLVEQREELAQDASGGSPDHVLGGHPVEEHRVRLAVPFPDLGVENGRVTQRGERDLDDALDLAPIGPELDRIPHDAHDRRDDEVGRAGLGVVEQAQDLDRLGGQTDLLPRLAERGLDPRAVAGLHHPARERELSLVMWYARRLLGEEHVRAAAIGDRHQHRRRDQVAAVERHPWTAAQRGVEAPADRLELHPAGHTKRQETLPSRVKEARTDWPALGRSTFEIEPVRTRSPARSPRPIPPSVLAAHASETSGLPSTSAAVWVATIWPSSSRTTPSSARSMPLTGVSGRPSTMALVRTPSATTSVPRGVPPSRKSISSKDGIAPSTARSAAAVVTPGPARSRFKRKATSTSTPIATKRERGTASPLPNTP